MSKIITITNTKGGVGKTTTSICLATLLSQKGKVLLKDSDLQGSATEWLDYIDDSPFDYEIANIRSLGKTKHYDYVIIDTPPQNTDIIKTAINVADLVIIPVGPSAVEVSRVFTMLEDIKDKHYQILLNNVDTRTNSFNTVKELFRLEGVNMFQAVIPKRESIKLSYRQIPGKTVLDLYEEIAEEIYDELLILEKEEQENETQSV